ncbi:hypothetical protein CASFOL_012154 [Castilleja foliolosa]|uniref:Uncharacterized protein n=1 Tax=Castilleja foliolosa TaxID=1961234 RepID=A0ABD3DS20_9LAMI
MEEKGSAKSRRELRKESGLAKNKKKFDSWVQHHSKKPSTSGLKTKHSSEANSVIVDKPKSKTMNLRNSGSTYPKMDSDFKAKKDLKRKMDSDRTPKTNFFKLLEMEKGGQVASAEDDLSSVVNDDLGVFFEGIPSALDNPGSRTSKTSNSVNDDLEDEISDDEGDGESDLLGSGDDDEDEESDLLGSGDDYVDSEEFDSLGSSEDDDDDDGLNMLVEDSEDKREQKVVTKLSSNIGTGKYVAPHPRSQGGNESVEYAQLRKRVSALVETIMLVSI